jgi:hypothetical protein
MAQIGRVCRLAKCLLMGMDLSRVQLDGVVNEEKVEMMRRYLEEINAKQRELQSQNGMTDEQMNINVFNINLLIRKFLFVTGDKLTLAVGSKAYISRISKDGADQAYA